MSPNGAGGLPSNAPVGCATCTSILSGSSVISETPAPGGSPRAITANAASGCAAQSTRGTTSSAANDG